MDISFDCQTIFKKIDENIAPAQFMVVFLYINENTMQSKAPAHLLLIDDKPEYLRSLLETIREQGWKLSLATDGQQGFYRAQALKPDLILLDVEMPVMDGFATSLLLKEAPETTNTPIIFLTSAGDDYQRLQGLQQGVDYITKPFLPAEVIARIRIHLQLSKATLIDEEKAPTENQTATSYDEVILLAVIRYVRENIAELPPLAAIALQVGTHEKRLSRIFREHLNTTVFTWIREERLNLGRKWLAESNMSIQDIADQLGFTSSANFATAFRTRMNVTPSEYRDQMQQKKRHK